MSKYTTGQWAKLPAEFYNGVTHVLMILGPETASWLSKDKVQDAAMKAWKEDKHIAHKNGGSYAAFPPMSLKAAVEYLSEHRPGLKLARKLNEQLIVRREPVPPMDPEEQEARHLTDAGGGPA